MGLSSSEWRAILSEGSFVTDASPLSCRLGYCHWAMGLLSSGGLYCLKEASLLTIALSLVDWAMGLLSLGYGTIIIWMEGCIVWRKLCLCWCFVCVGGVLLSALGFNATACMQKEKNKKQWWSWDHKTVSDFHLHQCANHLESGNVLSKGKAMSVVITR